MFIDTVNCHMTLYNLLMYIVVGDGGKALSFKTQGFKVQSTRNHYTKCLFDKGFPHLDEDGKISKSLNYPCKVCPSKKSRKMGYKEYTSHMAKEHGGLEEILSEHKDEKVRQLLTKFRKSEC